MYYPQAKHDLQGNAGEIVMRTTGLQVSGYAFLLRRTELALVIGDPRMAQDPLRAQRRALGVGILLSLLVAGGMLLVAFLRPQPSIDGAGLVEDESGALHVRIDDSFHPVSNVASARLLLGEPAEITRSTSAQLATFPAGPPVGIPDAPGLVTAGASQWALCATGVVAAPGMEEVGPVVLDTPSGMWLVVEGSRMLLGDSGDIGRVLARALGAVPVTANDRMLRVLDRGPDIALTSLESLVTSGNRAYLVGEAGVAEVNGARRAVAEALVAGPATERPLTEILAQPEVRGTAALSQLPEDVTFRSVEEICVGDRVVDAAPLGEVTHFSGPRGTSALLTERGFVLVSQAGVRYTVASVEELESLGDWDGAGGSDGARGLPEVPHRVVEPLPDGEVLSQERAAMTVAAGVGPGDEPGPED